MENNTKKSAFRIAAIALPFFALLIWTLSVHHAHSNGKTIRVKITGYDPVDPLSGHYLRFRYDFGPLDICSKVAHKEETCICADSSLTPDGPKIASQKLSCAIGEKTCSNLVKGSCQYQTFLTGAERYFFPEAYATVLATIPEGSEAEIVLQENGTVGLKEIFVHSKPILEYAREKLP